MCNKETLKCNNLFATHYHELTKLEGVIEGVKNYSVAVTEKLGEVIFLRKIVEGGADQSYGIEVAKLAGLPEGVIERAKEILHKLEGEKSFDESHELLSEQSNKRKFMAEENVAEEIKETVVDTKQEAVVDLEKDSKKEEKVTVETNDTIQIDFPFKYRTVIITLPF